MATESELPRYTWEEISKHNTSASLWVVIDSKIYDVTKFKDEHPGGEEILQDNAAKDATAAFEDIGHSADAIELRKSYLIGIVADKGPKRSFRIPVPEQKTGSWLLPALAVVALAVGIAIAYRIYKK